MANFEVVNVSLPIDKKPPDPTKWDMCILCQKMTKEDLTDPRKNTRTNDDSYKALSSNLAKFHEINLIPLDVDIIKLADGKVQQPKSGPSRSKISP